MKNICFVVCVVFVLYNCLVNQIGTKIFVDASNYLEASCDRYTCSSAGIVYKTRGMESLISKIVRIASWFLIFPYGSACAARVWTARPVSVIQQKPPPKPKTSTADVLATRNCEDTQAWRKALVHAARHNIVFSGNYCGGSDFQEILSCISLRMKEVPSLQVVILAHPKFIDSKSKKMIRALQKRYKTRFCLVKSPNFDFGGKNITNHTKCFSIDYGTYFIQGGSAIKDNFAGKGCFTASSTKKQKMTVDDCLGELFHRRKSETGEVKTADDQVLVTSSTKSKKSKKGDFWSSVLPSQFRDQDFVFRSEDPERTVYRELLYLAFKWREHERTGSMLASSWDLNSLEEGNPLALQHPVLRAERATALSAPPALQGNPLDTLLQTALPETTQTDRPLSFAKQAISGAHLRYFFTGPEDSQSAWEKNLIERVELAKKRIVINQMYFHPTKPLLQALAKAADRGVQVQVLTCIGGQTASRSERFFGHKNLVCLDQFNRLVSEQNRKNLQFYAYKQGKNGLHKKIVVVDDFVCGGSSNMGYKSLVLTGDHEMNFEAKSSQLAEAVLKIFQEDLRFSQKLSTVSPTLTNHFWAWVHSLGANQWG